MLCGHTSLISFGMMAAMQSVSKLDAATRQLRMAILLYFQDGDALGVHTLAGAAHGILRDLLVRRDGRASVRYAREEGVQPDHREFVTKMVRDAKNFLKHADQDPDDLLTFNSDWTDFLLYEAAGMHIDLAKELNLESMFFLLWITAKYPNVLILDELLGAGVAELRRLFPALGDAKRTFLSALKCASPRVAAPSATP